MSVRSIVLRVLGATALLAVAVAGCRGLSGTLDEAAELIVEGGEDRLRDPMRPIRGTARLLVIALDGVGEVTLREALDAGDLPALAALVGAPAADGVFANGYLAPSVASVFPAETAAGWAAVYTGAPPAVSGITGNEWFDRDSLATFAPVPLSVGSIEQTLSIWSDDFFSDALQAPTVFERADLRAHVSLSFVFRGADLVTPPDLNDVGDILDGLFDAITSGREKVFTEVDDDTWEGVKRGAEQYGLPDLQVAYYPGVDLVAHAAGPAEQRAYLRDHIGPHIGRLLDLYRSQGVLDDTYVMVVSDHGHTDALGTDRNSLDAGGRDEPPALLDSLGYRLRDFTLDDDASDANVVMIYDEAVAMLYLANGQACPDAGDVCDWTQAPRLEEDVLPLAQAFRAASDADTTAVGGLSGALDLIFVRASDPSGKTAPPYQVLDGGRAVPVADYLQANPRPDLVRLEERLGWLTQGPLGHRAGDILLLAKAGGDRPVEERFYFGSPRLSGHGSASASDAYISLLVATPSQTGDEIRRAVREAVGPSPTQLDVTPLMLSLLDVAE